MKIGFSGQPSAAQAQHLAALGHEVLTPDLAGGNALVAQSDVIVLAADPHAGTPGIDDLAPGLAEGKIVVDRTGRDPAAARALSDTLARLGVDMVEAPASGHYRAETGVPPVTLLAGPDAGGECAASGTALAHRPSVRKAPDRMRPAPPTCSSISASEPIEWEEKLNSRLRALLTATAIVFAAPTVSISTEPGPRIGVE